MLKAEVLKAQLMDSLGTVRIMWCLNGQIIHREDGSLWANLILYFFLLLKFLLSGSGARLMFSMIWCSDLSSISLQVTLSDALDTFREPEIRSQRRSETHLLASPTLKPFIMIDLSYLTEEEQEMILAVLTRDAELKKLEEQRSSEFSGKVPWWMKKIHKLICPNHVIRRNQLVKQ